MSVNSPCFRSENKREKGKCEQCSVQFRIDMKDTPSRRGSREVKASVHGTHCSCAEMDLADLLSIVAHSELVGVSLEDSTNDNGAFFSSIFSDCSGRSSDSIPDDANT